MRNFTITSISVFLFSLIAIELYTQEWTIINPSPTTEYLWGTHFLNQDTGFVCGQYGTIFRTTNGGDTWEENDTLTYGVFKAITFVNSNKGFVVGTGDIARTDDCGKSWYSQGPYVLSDYHNIFFLDETYGWVVGDYNTILRTQDGGDSWQLLSHSYWSDNYYYDVKFISPDIGYISGRYGLYSTVGILKKTTDGGGTWIDIPVPDYIYSIDNIDVFGEGDIYIDGEVKMYHTITDGASWDTITFHPYYINIKDFKVLDYLNIKILDGYGIYYTDDGGENWDYSTITYQNYFTNLFWLDSEFCYTSGSGGMIMHSSDGGLQWTELSSGFRANLNDVLFIDELNGIIVGSNGEEEKIYTTDDGGFSWEQSSIDTNISTSYLKALVYSPNGKAWAVGWWNMLSSDDHGATWQVVDNGFEGFAYNDIELYQDQFLWAGGTYGHMIRSNDQGATWEDISLPFEDHINIIAFCDSLHGLLTVKETLKSGYTYLYSTEDGGESWHKLLHPGDISPIWYISYPDKNTIYLSVHDHGIIRSRNGGDTWETLGEVGGVMPRYIKFDNAEAGLVALTDCMVAHTLDGGDTWEVDLSLETRYGLNPTYFHNLSHGWLVGDDGLIMKYENPLVRIPEAADFTHIGELPWIYPNPACDFLRLRPGETIRQILFYDTEGNIVLSRDGNNSDIIDISKLASGSYIVTFLTEDGFRTEKLIKK